jgi:hypothetical protein
MADHGHFATGGSKDRIGSTLPPVRGPKNGASIFPRMFMAKLIVERLPAHVHTAMLDAVVIVGGTVMIFCTVRWC